MGGRVLKAKGSKYSVKKHVLVLHCTLQIP